MDELTLKVALAMLQSHYRQNGADEPTELGAFDQQYVKDAVAALEVVKPQLDALTTLQAERDASRKLVQQAMVALAHRRPTGSDCKVAYALLQDARAKLSPPVI